MIRFGARTNAHAFKGAVTPVESTTRLLWNDTSVCQLTLDDDDRMLPHLVPGENRVEVRVDGVTCMEGPVVERAGTGPKGTVKVTVLDDFGQLDDILGWPNPSQPLTSQTDEYWRLTGPLETVVKEAIRVNVERLGLPWTVEASAGRGGAVTAEIRFHTPYDKFVPFLKAQQLLTLQVRRVGGGFVVSTRTGRTFSRPLTLASGVIDSYAFGQKRAAKTRIVAGGQGQGTDRVFVQATGDEAAGIREGFKDARATEDPAYLPGQAQDALAAARATASVSAALNEASWFRFGAYDLGDLVTIDLGFLTVTDVIGEVEIKHTVKDGLVVTPKVGLLDSSPDARVYELLSRLRAASRDQEKR